MIRNYKIIIYDNDNLDAYGTYDPATVMVSYSTYDFRNLVKAWKFFIGEFEGCEYQVLDNDHVIVGGAYDPGDIDYLLEQL